MGLLNPGGPIAQSQRNRCSIWPVEVISLSGVRNEFVDYRFSVSETNLNVDVIDAYLTVLDEKDPLSFKIDIENTLRAFKENSKSKHDSTLSDRLISDTHILIR